MAEQMYEIARLAFEQTPQAVRFREIDAQVIKRHRDALLALEPEVIRGFYDTLYAHPATGAVFVEGERPDRELTLSNWWRRTVNGPLDEEYFAWMAMVGLVHAARKVTNAMMLSMASFVGLFVAEKAAQLPLDRAEADALVDAFRRLGTVVGIVITLGYDRAYDRAVLTALDDLAGMPEPLFKRLLDQEIRMEVNEARRRFF
jgi:hypothetical protein